MFPAQRSQVVHVPRFLSKSEVDTVVSLANDYANLCGVSKRDKNGVSRYADYTWKTLYVHTDNLFQRMRPRLFRKIQEKVLQVDTDMEWGLIKNIPSEKINARTIEVHEGFTDGGLTNNHHFDGNVH